ncbi:MAG: N-acetyltransferase family protein [Bdellovibrionales bacterium]
MKDSIREIKAADAEAFAEFLTRLDQETKSMLFEPGERNVDPNYIRNRLEKVREDDELFLILQSAGKITGFLSANRGLQKRTRHRAYLVIGLLRESCGQGNGRELMNRLLHWSAQKSLKRLELTVAVSNATAIGLYKKVGFMVEGTRSASLFVDGQWVDEFTMAKIL